MKQNDFVLDIHKNILKYKNTIDILYLSSEYYSELDFEAIEYKDRYEIDTASDGIEAVKFFTKNQHDIIFMDIMMPNMDGFEAARTIRLANNIAKEPAIVMLTALDDKESVQKAFISGANWYMIKPYQMEDLELLINDLVVKKPYMQRNIESLVKKKITAQEFMQSFFLEFSLHKLEHFNEELLVKLNEYEKTREISKLKEIAALLKEFSYFIEVAKEFKKIPLALFDLAETLEEIQSISDDDFFLSFIYSLLTDLEKWTQNIFFDQVAIDIHYLDDSLVSSIVQLKTLLKPEFEVMFEAEEDDCFFEDDIEFF